jgi:hypothetical protein
MPKQEMPESPRVTIMSVAARENKLTAKIQVSAKIARCFLGDTFVAEYESNIEDVPESILSIPVLAPILTVAWAVGADIYLNEVDETYLAATDGVKAQFQRWYPNMSFSTKIHAKKIVANKFNNTGKSMLFSGGVDSLFSCAQHIDKNPTLIPICGGDIPYDADKFWAKIRNWLSAFATDNGLNITFIKTNMRDPINRRFLEKQFGIATWWGYISHGLILLSLCAPLTTKQIGVVRIASTHTSDFNHPWGSHPLIDNEIAWADVKVLHDGYDFSRQEKIHYIVNKRPDFLKYFRVCYLQLMEYNCGRCEKCLRTIASLLLEGKDPQDCNFNMSRQTLDLIKRNFSKREIYLGEDERFMWQDIQNHIPDDVGEGAYGEKEFFEWLRQYDMKNYRSNKVRMLIYYVTYFSRYKSPSDMARHAHRKIRQIWKAACQIVRDIVG